MQPFAVVNHSMQQPLSIHHLKQQPSNTYLPAVIAVAMIVGKYKGNQEGKRFYSRNCTGSRSDSIS
jgi:hypothetical protein